MTEENEHGLVTGFSKEGRASISVSLTKGTLDYSTVRIVVNVAGPEGGVQLLAEDTANQWWNIVKSGWGTSEGFALADATTVVYPVVSKAGAYTVTVKVIDLADSNKVLAEAQCTVNVPAP